MDPLQPILRSHLIREGVSDQHIRRQRSTGQWQRVGSGVYIPCTVANGLDNIGRHRLMIEAAATKVGADSVFSHASAAVLHGMTLWNVPLRLVHTTRPIAASGYTSNRLHVHPGPVPEKHIVMVDEHPATSAAWTVVALARALPFEEAIAVGDGALHLGLTTIADLREILAELSGRPGTKAAAAAVDFMDGRSESVGESRSRVRLMRAGLPTPDLQRNMYSADGVFLGRVDFHFKDHNTIGEFDGEEKYRLSASESAPGRALFDEKVREDALRDEGSEVVRWFWRNLTEFHEVAARLRRAFRR